MYFCRILLVFICLSHAVFARPSAVVREIREGDKYFKTFNIERAIDHYHKAASLDPKNFEARLKFLRANNSMGQDLRDRGADKDVTAVYFKKNVELAEKLYNDFPNRAESSFSVAVAYGNLALYSTPKEKVRMSRDVETNLKRALQLDPKFSFTYLGLGIFYREVAKITFLERFFANLFFGEIPKGTVEDAIANFKVAIRGEPNFIFTHYHYALALVDAGKTEEAVKEYQIVLNLPQTDSGDPMIKERARKNLAELIEDNPSLLSHLEGSVSPSSDVR